MNDYTVYKAATDRIQELEQQHKALDDGYDLLLERYKALKEFATSIVNMAVVGARESEDISFLLRAINIVGEGYNKKLDKINADKGLGESQ
jgi:hypothetical protein